MVEAEVGKELRILLEMLRQLSRWLLEVSVVIADHASRPEYLLILKQTALRYEQLHIVINWEDHQLPVYYIEHLSLGCDYQVAVVSVADLVV